VGLAKFVGFEQFGRERGTARVALATLSVHAHFQFDRWNGEVAGSIHLQSPLAPLGDIDHFRV